MLRIANSKALLRVQKSCQQKHGFRRGKAKVRQGVIPSLRRYCEGTPRQVRTSERDADPDLGYYGRKVNCDVRSE